MAGSLLARPKAILSPMKARACLMALPLVAASCLSTKVELDTEVYADGTVQRRLVVTSSDDGEAAEHPAMLRLGGAGYGLLRQETGSFEASGVFGPGQPIPPALSFHADSLDRSAPAAASLVIQDWGLFRRFRYRERLADVVDPDEIRLVVEEAAVLLLENADDTLERLIGPHYLRTRLHAEVSGGLGELARELALQLWRATALEDFDEERVVRRACAICRRAGIPVDADLVLAAFEQGEESEAYFRLRRELGDWAAGMLEIVDEEETGGRRPAWPDMKALLFDGPLELAFQEELVRRFGGEQGLEEWAGKTWTRIFGLFGSGAGDIDFHLRVRLPGDPLKSNGYLSGDGAAFLEFPASAIYPGGAGLSSESVLWEPGVTGALPGFRRLPTNELAVRWTWLAGEGPASAPDPALVELLKRCALARSWAPFEERLRQEPARAERWAEALAWLKGEKD